MRREIKSGRCSHGSKDASLSLSPPLSAFLSFPTLGGISVCTHDLSPCCWTATCKKSQESSLVCSGLSGCHLSPSTRTLCCNNFAHMLSPRSASPGGWSPPKEALLAFQLLPTAEGLPRGSAARLAPFPQGGISVPWRAETRLRQQPRRFSWRRVGLCTDRAIRNTCPEATDTRF